MLGSGAQMRFPSRFSEFAAYRGEPIANCLIRKCSRSRETRVRMTSAKLASSHKRKSRGLMQRLTCRFFFLCSLVLIASASLMADVTGSIQGYVRDSSGAVITGARVTVTETATNFQRETNTDSQGAYTFLALPPGHYRINASITGFRQATLNDIDLRVNDELRYDLTLAVGATQDTVSVEANAVQVETVATSTGTTPTTSTLVLSMRFRFSPRRNQAIPACLTNTKPLPS